MVDHGLMKYCFRLSSDEKKINHNKKMIKVNHQTDSTRKKVKLPENLLSGGNDNIQILQHDSDDDSDTSAQPTRNRKEPKIDYSDFNSFTNQNKKIIGEPDDYSESDDNESGSSSGSEDMSDASSESEVNVNQEKLLKKQQKYEILSKLQQLERRGITLSKNYNMKSKLHDLQFELKRVTDVLDKESGLKFGRKVLMAFVTGVEYANKRFDPVQAKLEGWSESVMENVEDYDRAIIRLVEKYSGSVEVAPEIELVMALVGSGFMFHLSKSILQNPVGILSSLGQQNPDMLENVMKNVMKSVRPPQQQGENNGKGMTPPSFNVSDLLGGLQQKQPDDESETGSSEYTDDETDDDDIKLVQVPEDKLKKRRR